MQNINKQDKFTSIYYLFRQVCHYMIHFHILSMHELGNSKMIKPVSNSIFILYLQT